MTRTISLIFLSLLFFSACGQNTSYKQLNSLEFYDLIINSEAILLDVRTSGEFKNGHIQNAKVLNYYSLSFRRKLLTLPKGQAIYLYCNTGYRSRKAAEILTKRGYNEVYNLEHGILEWNLNDLPVVVDSDATPDTENRMETDEFAALINSGKLVFVDFYAPWCGPCRKMMPMIDQLKKDYKGDITIVKINIDSSKKLAKDLKILTVPYFVLYKDGEILSYYKGIVDKQELKTLFDRHLSISL